LQTGRGPRREEREREIALARTQRLGLLLDVRLLLRGDGEEEAYERAQLVRREAERGHAHAQVGAHAVAVLAGLSVERALHSAVRDLPRGCVRVRRPPTGA